MPGPRPVSALLADLHGGDPARVGAALRELVAASEAFDEEPVSLPYPGLAPLRGMAAPPEALQLDLVRLLSGYGAFDPPVDRDRVIADLVELALAHGSDRVAMEAAFLVKDAGDPAVLAAVLDRLARHVAASGPTPGAVRLGSYLLAGPPVFRARVVRALHRPDLAPLRDRLVPELAPDERAGP